jgi:hypothetical protein
MFRPEFSSALEPWATELSDGTTTIDTAKLAAASDYVYSKRYNWHYSLVSFLISLSKSYFSVTKNSTEEHLIKLIMHDKFIGITLAVCYADKSKWENLSKLTSIWD